MTDTELRALVRKYYNDAGWPDELFRMGLGDATKFAEHFYNLGSKENAELKRQLIQMRNERDGEREAREKTADALRQKDEAMGVICELAGNDVIERAQVILQQRHASRQSGG